MSNNNPPKAQIVLVGWGPTPSDVHRFLEERGCFDAYNKLLAIDLFSMVSRKEQAIAGMIGVNRRATAHGYLKELIDAGILCVEKASIGGKNCFRYIFTIFDLYANDKKPVRLRKIRQMKA